MGIEMYVAKIQFTKLPVTSSTVYFIWSMKKNRNS